MNDFKHGFKTGLFFGEYIVKNYGVEKLNLTVKYIEKKECNKIIRNYGFKEILDL